MDTEQSLFQFIDFYLGHLIPQKNIDLLKDKIDQKSKKIEDPLLREVSLIKDTIGSLTPHARIRAVLRTQQQTVTDRLYSEVRRLHLRDCLILTSGSLFPIETLKLSLALQLPIESIQFRRDQISVHLKEEGLDLDHLQILNASGLIHDGQPEVKSTIATMGFIQRIQRLPTAVRFLIETTLVLAGLMGILWIIPEIRNRYETSIQKRINDYLIESSLVDAPPPAGLIKPSVPNSDASAPIPPIDGDEEETNNQKSSFEDAASKKQPKVNEGETWRFSFTGSATNEIEAAISDALKKISSSETKPTTVPGGIQYDFILPVSNVLELKVLLEKSISELRQKSGTKNTLGNLASFSWYKKRNMGTRKIPSAHVQVIIWISTL